MAKDRHRPGYWKERYQKLKESGKLDKTDRHRPGYYREYNKKHPERLARVGISLTPKNEKTIGFDFMGRPITDSKLTDQLNNKEGEYICDEDEV